jgi:hypothetical protein
MGLIPHAIRDVNAAWKAFGEFLQDEIEGIERSEEDGDGFIVEWGRWDWNDDQPALSFGRLLAVNDAGERDDPHWQAEYWELELQLVFTEDPAWADLDRIGFQSTGFDYNEIGEPRIASLAEICRVIESYPQLAAMSRAQPISSDLALDRAG